MGRAQIGADFGGTVYLKASGSFGLNNTTLHAQP